MAVNILPDPQSPAFAPLFAQMDLLAQRHAVANSMKPDYFEPGFMEFPDHFRGSYDSASCTMILCFEAMGTRYEGRIPHIEKLHAGDPIRILRESENRFNPCNFTLTDALGHSVGNMPRDLCNALAPLYDAGSAAITETRAGYVEPLSARSRYASHPVLFIEMHLQLVGSLETQA